MWRSIMCLALIPLSAAALAEDFDYSFVQGSYGQVDFDGIGDGDGFGLGGSLALSDSFHVFGEYETGEIDVDVLGQSFSADFDGFEAGLGFHTPVSDTVDLVASLSYLSLEVDALGVSDDADGYGLGVGLRAMASPAVELNGGISYADMGGDSSGDTSFGAGFLYHFSDAFAAGLSGSWGDDVSSYALSGRFSFGQ